MGMSWSFGSAETIFCPDSNESANLEGSTLNLNSCGIENLNFTEIDSANVAKTDYITLYNNSLTYLVNEVFSKFVNMKSLHLNKNKIAHIDVDAFHNLPKLEDLALADNQLIFLRVGVFDPLVKLNKIELEGNQLKFLENGIFTKNEALTDIDLKNNQIVAHGSHVFSNGKPPNLENNVCTKFIKGTCEVMYSEYHILYKEYMEIESKFFKSLKEKQDEMAKKYGKDKYYSDQDQTNDNLKWLPNNWKKFLNAALVLEMIFISIFFAFCIIMFRNLNEFYRIFNGVV